MMQHQCHLHQEAFPDYSSFPPLQGRLRRLRTSQGWALDDVIEGPAQPEPVWPL